MTTPKIKGGKVKSIRSLKNQLKKGGGNNTFLTRVPKDGALVVRFLTEPDQWITYYEHFDDAEGRAFPCVEGCGYCKENKRASQRYVANAVDVDEGKTVPLLLPKSAASSVMKKYDRNGTLLDRDYEISRTGEGLDTEYEAMPEAPTKMNLDRYELLDLWAIVEGMLSDTDDDDEEDDDDDLEEEAPRRPRKKASSSRRRAVVEDDEDEDEDEKPRRKPVTKRAVKKRSMSRK